ncbi:MAG: MFS transporter [Paramuribaculum sp.]|nr:MFS transporter [Paramuribaculum sp.]
MRPKVRAIVKGFSWVPSLYFAEGLPYIIVMSLAGIMYTRMGVDNSRMALFTSLLTLPWVIKPLWSPFVDIFSSRRRWIVVTQISIAAILLAIALAIPGQLYFRITIGAFFIVAFLSATYDIAADGFYIDALDSSMQSFFVGIRTTFYRIAMMAAQGPLVMLAGYFEQSSGDIPGSWALIFYILSGVFIFIAVYHFIVLPSPDARIKEKRRSGAEVWSEFLDTFRSFFMKPGIGGALLFILLYRLPEAQLVKLIPPFLLDSVENGGLGLTTVQEGAVYGTVGVIGLLAGGITGGIVASRSGLRRWLKPMAWSMSLTCLTFVYLSFADAPSLLTVNICVGLEQFGYGFGCTAYMLYLLMFSAGDRPASHYAVCTGLMALGIMLPGMVAGYIQQLLGYRGFFLWTTLCCVATVGVCYMIRLPKHDE